MASPRFSGVHQTILVVAVSLAAVVGSTAGAVGAVVMTGAISASDVLDQFTEDASDVDRHIVELIEEESATISVVDNLAPSVVSVVIKLPRYKLFEEEFTFDPFYQEPPVSTWTDEERNELIEIGGGTGFFMSADGYIVTNRHVVSDDEAVYTVVTDDGEELAASIVAEDAFLDIAVLDVDGEGYPVAELGDSGRIRIGQTVIAIGNTLSEYRNTVTKGVISGINRRVLAGDDYGFDEVIEGAIQTDAAINPGNSGGPLINLLGEVIGVNTAISYEGQSVGFAIPINDVRQIVEDIEQYGRIVRPWVGVRYVPVDPTLVVERELSHDYGVLLLAGDDPVNEPAIVPGSPAEAAGLREGDVILSVNGEKLTLEQSLAGVVSQYNPGDTVELEVVRADEALRIRVTLAELEQD